MQIHLFNIRNACTHGRFSIVVRSQVDQKRLWDRRIPDRTQPPPPRAFRKSLKEPSASKALGTETFSTILRGWSLRCPGTQEPMGGLSSRPHKDFAWFLVECMVGTTPMSAYEAPPSVHTSLTSHPWTFNPCTTDLLFIRNTYSTYPPFLSHCTILSCSALCKKFWPVF